MTIIIRDCNITFVFSENEQKEIKTRGRYKKKAKPVILTEKINHEDDN